MASRWREIRRRARRDLHRELMVESFCYPTGDPADPPARVNIRVWPEFMLLGDMKGTSFEYAEVEENSPMILVMKEDLVPRRGMVFSVEPGEAYRVDRVKPLDDISYTCPCVRLSESEAAGFAAP